MRMPWYSKNMPTTALARQPKPPDTWSLHNGWSYKANPSRLGEVAIPSNSDKPTQKGRQKEKTKEYAPPTKEQDRTPEN